MSLAPKLLKSVFTDVLTHELTKRIKEHTLETIDLIMYFGDQQSRNEMNDTVLPELMRKLHFISLIHLQQRLESFMEDFNKSWVLVTEEIKKRKKMVGAK